MVPFAVMASCTLADESHTASPGRADWQSILAESVRSPGELCRLLGLDPSLAVEAERAAGGLPLLVPRPFLARIRRGDPADPLLMQVLPGAAELVGRTGLSGRPARRGRGDLLPWLASEVSRPNLDRSRSVLRRPLSVLLPAALSEWVAATRLPSPYGRGIRGQGSGGWGLGSGGWGLGAGTRVQGSGVSISRSQIPNLPISNHKISKSPDLQISKSGRPSP